MPSRKQARHPAPASRMGGGHDPHLLETPSQVRAAAEELASEPILAFDTEFLRERTFFPDLGLVQVAGRGRAYVIDPLAVDHEGMEPLLQLLEREDILKVAHAADQDQECLYHAYGRVAKPLLDTAVGAALTGRGEQIGLVHLLRKLLDIHLPKTHSRANWMKRPLSQEMLRYALADVEHLVEAAEKLLEDLDHSGRREWALKLSAELSDPKRFVPQPDMLAARIASSARLTRSEYAVLRALTRWREERVRQANLPRRWVADDDLLVRLARSRPRTQQALANLGGLSQKVVSQHGGGILAAIEQGRAAAPETPEPPRKLEPRADETPALNVLKCYLGLLAHERRVPLRFLVDNEATLLLLRARPRTVEELRDAGLLNAGALELFGEEIIEVLQGQRAMKIHNGRAVRFDPNGAAGGGGQDGRS